MNDPEQINYDVNYFISFFEAIPPDNWCITSFDSGFNSYCALGHCGVRNSLDRIKLPVARSLEALFREIHLSAPAVNDGGVSRFNQSTPKQRILAALYEIQAKQDQKAQLAYHQKLLAEAEQTPPKPAIPAPPLQITSGWPSVTMAQPATVREVV